MAQRHKIPNPSGLCMCGCGRVTTIARGTDIAAFQVAGEHMRFVQGHRPNRSPLGDPGHPLRHDAWFAGFVDGEGCFFIQPAERGTKVGLTVGLRADDRAILMDCRAAFGGSLHQRPSHGGSQPKVVWTAQGREERAGLVQYFDAFPLLTKKARDYAIWRIAALDISQAPTLSEALRVGRGFQ